MGLEKPFLFMNICLIIKIQVCVCVFFFILDLSVTRYPI